MSINKIYAWGSTAAVVLAILTGLVISGTPGEQRLKRFDQKRVNDLRSLTYNIENHRNIYKSLPDSLEQLIGAGGGYRSLDALPRDPETDMVYMYIIESENTYRLCAEFNRALNEQNHSAFWDHDAGYYCYEIVLPALPVETS